MNTSKATEEWSTKIAGLAADALVDRGLLKHEQFDQAEKIIAEEIKVRLELGDYPVVTK